MNERIIITDANDIVVGIGISTDESDYFKNPRLALDDGSKVSFAFDINIYNNVDTGDEISPFEYCYHPDVGFYKTPEEETPEQNIYGISDEIYCAIKNEAVDEIKREVRKNVD
ncbi:hypothetical protein AALA22_11770 [Anaerovoracaceae bacterium 41-7]